MWPMSSRKAILPNSPLCAKRPVHLYRCRCSEFRILGSEFGYWCRLQILANVEFSALDCAVSIRRMSQVPATRIRLDQPHNVVSERLTDALGGSQVPPHHCVASSGYVGQV